jgi:hypothetical protein
MSRPIRDRFNPELSLVRPIRKRKCDDCFTKIRMDSVTAVS